MMKVDLFFSTEPLPLTPGYGLIESIDFIPALHAYWYSHKTGKAYEIVSILQTVDRTICVCLERTFDAQALLSIPSANDAPDLCYPVCA